MSEYTFGAFDLLKIISSHPSLGYSRTNRWNYLGLVNEPCFEPAKGPDANRRGLWLDVRGKDCAADPFENESKYPGVLIGARGKPLGDGTTLPAGSFYGYATGVMGLRLFPNPDFDEKAAKAWDPERYYTDPSYYNRKDLVRPYRVGMSCGFCHIGPSPVNPPADPENPQFANLSSSVGAQYMWVDRLFIFNSNKPEGRTNFMYQLAHTFRPGAMDTSLISTDGINNPRTMNALYNVLARMEYNAEKLMAMTQEALDELFKASPAGEIPNGPAKGTAIIAPGTAYTANVAEMISHFGWQGKVFDAQKGVLKNRILAFGLEAIVAKVYKGKSWLDDKECIVLDYSETSLIAQWVRDEIRQIGPGFYLGKVYFGKKRLIDFCLQF